MKQKIITPPLQNIRITDPLFGRYAEIIADKLLPYQWEVLNDRLPDVKKSYCVQNFRIAAGEIDGTHRGPVFCDTDAYKWLETLAYCLASGRGLQYEAIADELIDLIGRAQEADGYLHTYFTISNPDKKWTNLAEGHELYNAGHLIEAAVAYYNATGKDTILGIACRLADLIGSVFGSEDGKHKGYSGHQEIELALMKLSRVTGKNEYADLARYFLEIRGQKPNYLLAEMAATRKDRIIAEFADYDDKYAQTHLPPTKQTTAEGHAVRAMYMYSAMADVAEKFDDPGMTSACEKLWGNVTNKRMYITGGVGSSGRLERFTTDYDLPNDRMYCESCASVGLMMFGQRMAALTGNARYYDTVERALCNTVLAGISAEGDKYFYVNPLEVWPDNCLSGTSMAHVKPVRQSWFGVACCPANIARTLASVGQYIYAQDERSLYINQFISSSVETTLTDAKIKLSLTPSLLTDGKVRFIIDTDKPQGVSMRIRIPYYVKDPKFTLDGSSVTPLIENGYAVVSIASEGSHTLDLIGKITPQWVAANSHVRADAGCIALTYGPYVYCLEQTDNGTDLPNLYVSPNAEILVSPPCRELVGELPILTFVGKRLDSGTGDALYGAPNFTLTEQTITAIPYGLWCNREVGEMLVWMKALL